MKTTMEGQLLWEPSQMQKESSRMVHYMQWLNQHHGFCFADYESLYNWSVDSIEDFWSSIWEYFEIESSAPYTSVLEG